MGVVTTTMIVEQNGRGRTMDVMIGAPPATTMLVGVAVEEVEIAVGADVTMVMETEKAVVGVGTTIVAQEEVTAAMAPEAAAATEEGSHKDVVEGPCVQQTIETTTPAIKTSPCVAMGEVRQPGAEEMIETSAEELTETIVALIVVIGAAIAAGNAVPIEATTVVLSVIVAVMLHAERSHALTTIVAKARSGVRKMIMPSKRKQAVPLVRLLQQNSTNTNITLRMFLRNQPRRQQRSQ